MKRFLVLILMMAPITAMASDCQRVLDVVTFEDKRHAPMGASCQTFNSHGGEQGVACWWSFDYRDHAAQDFAQTFWDDVTRCFAGAELGRDMPVNHPDSYDLRQWQSPKQTFALSLKDKAAIAQTLVFLRMSHE